MPSTAPDSPRSRAAARQLVSHAHIDVDGQKVNHIPSFQIAGSGISVRATKRGKGY